MKCEKECPSGLYLEEGQYIFDGDFADRDCQLLCCNFLKIS